MIKPSAIRKVNTKPSVTPKIDPELVGNVLFRGLPPALTALLEELVDHPKMASIGVGRDTVMVYVTSKQAKNQIEARIPEESRSKVHVLVTGKPRLLNKKAK